LGLIVLYPAQARGFIDELREEDWELVESREVFLVARRLYAETGVLDRTLLLAALAEPVSGWLQAVLRTEEARPQLGEHDVTSEQERCLRDVRRRLRRARMPGYSAMLRDLEESGDVEAAREIGRQVERELAQLENDER